MANEEHLKIINQGVDAWNTWRREHRDTRPEFSDADFRRANLRGANLCLADLSEADLGEANLRGADLSRADLFKADLSGADLGEAKLIGANLNKADLTGAQLTGASLYFANLNRAALGRAHLSGADLNTANLSEANLRGALLSKADLFKADLSGAYLTGAHLSEAKFIGANLHGASLMEATLVETNIESANLNACRIYGISAWNLTGVPRDQLDLIITRDDEPIVTIDNLEVAQFVYLLLHNEKIRDVLDTIGRKGVLILGRFTKDRKVILDAIRNRLRELGFVPIMFDFERPTQWDFTETIKTLAGLSRFIIADITNPRSSPLELQATMPDYMIPFVPIIAENEEPFPMFRDLKQKYGEWVLDVLRYDSADNLLKALEEAVVKPALETSQRLVVKKAEAIRTRHVRDYM